MDISARKIKNNKSPYISVRAVKVNLIKQLIKLYLYLYLVIIMKKLYLTLIFFCVLQLSYAQETIPSTGGNASGTGGTSSYTVGQFVFTTNISTTGSVSQGVQQAFEFQTLSNPGLSSAQLTAVTYPNPTTDFIVLKIAYITLKNLQYTLFDLNGKTIANNPIKTSSTEIPMKNLSIGMYLLKLTKKNKTLKTFKVIKKQ